MGEASHDPRPAVSGDGGDSGDEPSAEAGAIAAAQRFGPLTLRRFVKSDGRALLLYERPPPEGDPQ